MLNSLLRSAAVFTVLPLLLLSGGCAVSSSLQPPVAAEDLSVELALRLIGDWEGAIGERKAQFSAATARDGAAGLDLAGRIAGEDGEFRKFPPLFGATAELAGRRLLVVYPNLAQTMREGGYAEGTELLLLGRYYLFEFELDEDDELTLRTVSLTTYQEDEKSFKPIDFSLELLDGGIVGSDTAMIRSSIGRGLVEVREFGQFKRAAAPASNAAGAKPEQSEAGKTAAENTETKTEAETPRN